MQCPHGSLLISRVTAFSASFCTSSSGGTTLIIVASYSSILGRSSTSNWLWTRFAFAKWFFLASVLRCSSDSGASRKKKCTSEYPARWQLSLRISLWARFKAEHVMIMWWCWDGCLLYDDACSLIASSHPWRSESVNGSPLCILSMLALGWSCLMASASCF